MKLPMRGPWLAAEQGLVQRLEPVAQALLAVMRLADLRRPWFWSTPPGLALAAGSVGEQRVELAKRRRFLGVGARRFSVGATKRGNRRRHSRQRVELRMRLGRVLGA
jgi:hypothetical protein